MALSLNAEQRNIMDLFVNEKLYKIPGYQRPYSWTFDQCENFYRDLYDAFRRDDDYFIGNLVLAHGRKNKNNYEVVDGQQRLITLWILLFVAHSMFDGLDKLERTLFIEGWSGSEKNLRIDSKVFENNDSENLLQLSMKNGCELKQRLTAVKNRNDEIVFAKCSSLIEYNALCYYYWFSYLANNIGTEKTTQFVRFIVDRVYMLPIELTDDDAEKASRQALTIFETLNDRGLNLEDADIFKEKLYNKSLANNKGNDFIEKWSELKRSCNNLGLKIDDVFRFYMHIIRGLNNEPGYNQNLRDFFTTNAVSPLLTENYDKVISDLNKIIETISWVEDASTSNNDVSAWLQLINAYTNQYPLYAVVAYIFKNPDPDPQKFIKLLQALVRYCFYKGATTSVDNEIYLIIRNIMHDEDVKNYEQTSIEESFFDRIGTMRVPYALLAFYLDNPKGLKQFNVDRILSNKDMDYQLENESSNTEVRKLLDSLGNAIVIDCSRRYGTFEKRAKYYHKNCDIKEVKSIFNPNDIPSTTIIEQRDRAIKNRLVQFFKGE
ncbi:MAG: DUF262 domain-containing protein [Muribaculaceae bacterium]|nr:DUF262 domain-containing protein [Muribaculaceae bacterium]